MGATNHDIGPGRRLGAFVIGERIGEGGFGAVYLATQEVLDRQAVVKVSHPSLAAEADRVAQFLREARLASRIDHPFAAHVYDFGAEADGTLWIAMELVRGTSLSDMLKAGALPRQRAIPLLNRLCEVVHTLHEQGIVHRDLKPHNVMVISRAGNMFPKLLDLGIASDLAKSIGSQASLAGTATGSDVAGTPMYMAPEQWVRNGPISPTTDVYSIGVLAYEVLTGKTPFTGNSPMELATQHARKAPPPLPGDFEADLSDVLIKAMAKRPKDRYQTALALGEALRDASGLAIDAVDLPALDPQLRDELMIAAPQPLAECIAAIDGARTPSALRVAMWQATYVIAAYAGNLALAARQRATGRHGDAPETQALLDKLATSSLDASDWWQLCRELVRPFADAPALYPLPELVEVFFTGSSALRNAMDTLLATHKEDPGPKASGDAIRTYLVGALLLLGKVLQSVRFLSAYPVVVVNNGSANYWMGLRRGAAAAGGVDATTDAVLLLDANDQLVCDLSSVAAGAESSAGSSVELFWLVGAHQDKAKCQALPGNLELRRDDIWPIHLGPNFEARLRGGKLEGEADKPTEDVPPYLGLATFGTGDVDRYFGREAEVVGFVNRMQGRRLIAVVGPSGSGKSSFVQAGVLPNLPSKHHAIVMRPGGNPLEALAFAVGQLGITTSPDELRSNPLGLALSLSALQQSGNEVVPLLLVVDQFEELVTMCLDTPQQAIFAEAILGLANHAALDAHVIITLRDDFLIRVAQVPGLRERLSASLHLLTTPVEEDLQRILVEPARRVGYTFEDKALVEEIAKEVSTQSAAMALLSFTAFQLWQFRDKHYKKLTRKAYQTLGGVGGALAHHAESVLGALSDDEQKSVREIFRHLVTADGTRASLSRDEILQVAGGQRANAVLERLITSRLLVAQEGPDNSERIEVIHEALLSAWPRLVKWRHEDAEGARLRDQLRVAAKQWADRGNDRGLLWRGDTLTEYRIWRSRYPGAVTTVEDAFATASLREAQRTQRIRRGILSVLAVALVVTAIVFAGLREKAVASEARANEQLTSSYVEQGRQLLVSNEYQPAILYLFRAFTRHSNDEAVPFMLARAIAPLKADLGTIAKHTSGVWNLELSPDRSKLLSSSDDGTVIVSDFESKKAIRTIIVQRGPLGSAIYATWINNIDIATAGPDGIVRIWNIETGSRIHERKLHDSFVTSLWWQPSTGSITSGSTDASLKRWTLATNDVADIITNKTEPGGMYFVFPNQDAAIAIRTGHEKRAWVIAKDGTTTYLGTLKTSRACVSADGVLAAAPSKDAAAVAIFNVKTGKSQFTTTPHDLGVTACSISPDLSRIATGSLDKAIRVTELASGNVSILRSHTGLISSLTFLDNNRLLSLSSDGSAKLWDTQREFLLATLPHGGVLTGAVYSDTRQELATSSGIGTVKLWDTSGDSLPFSLGAGDDNRSDFFAPPIFTTPNSLIYADNGGISKWDLTSRAFERFNTEPGLAGQIGLTNQMKTIISLDGTGVLRLLNLQDFGIQKIIGNDILMVAINPVTHEFATVGKSNLLTWHEASGATAGTHQLTEEPFQLLWSANGKTLAAVGFSAGISIFDAKAKQLTSVIPGEFTGIDVPPDGSYIVASGTQSEKLFGLTGNLVVEMNHTASIKADEISAAGDQLYVGLDDGTIAIWSLPAGVRVATLQGGGGIIRTISASKNYLFSTTYNNEILIYDLFKFRLVAKFIAPSRSLWAGTDPTNHWLLSIDREGSLTVRDIAPLTSEDLASGKVEEIISHKIDSEFKLRSGLY
ncbi:MAG: protein kinase [Myxococcales bacterium]|nr:protein kinase [Myxococcales bacterium]